jgi:hypothetical protein
MARSKYAEHVGSRQRRNLLTRDEWRSRATEFAARGTELPQTKLLPLDIGNIRSAQRQRVNLLNYIRENLSNAALAKAHGVHERTIEKVLSRETGSNVA